MPRGKTGTEGDGVLFAMYAALHDAYGPQHWWPAETATEVVIGAILTQNTAWTNVEKAIAALKAADGIDFATLAAMGMDELAVLIRSAGTYRVKAARLKAFATWIATEFDGDLRRALAGDVATVRARLLTISGIGPETADAILLYAGDRATFVVDAYTRRVLRRHLLADAHATYDDVQRCFESALPRDVKLFNEYHALLVEVGKRHCRATADCRGCPLDAWPHDAAR